MKIFRYFFYNQVTITSNKSPEEVFEILKGHLDDEKSFFDGYITNYKFNIYERFRKSE